jgi:guanine nucleotide-binding protein subunit alpha
LAGSHLFEFGSFHRTVIIGHLLSQHLTHIVSCSILDALAPEADAFDEHDDGDSLLETASVIITSNGRPPSAILANGVANYDIYRRRLEPLVELEERLIHLLSAPDEDEPSHLNKPRPAWEQYANIYNTESLPPPSKSSASSPTKTRPSPSILIPQKKPTSSSSLSGSTASSSYISSQSPYSTDSSNNELAVHTSTDWKKAFQFGSKSKSPKSAHTGEIEGWWEDPDDPVHILNACGPTMHEMWRDPQVKKCLDEKRLRLEESSGL